MSGALIPVIIDLETTGINIDHDSIVQMAAVMLTFVDGEPQPITLISTYCNPGRPIEAEASEVHGIKDEDLVYSVPAVWALQQLKLVLNALEGEDNTVILCGQNSERFDIPMMDVLLPAARFGSYLSIDTYTIAIRNFPEMPHKLGEFYSWYLEKETLSAHDAAADCVMCAEILAKYLKERGVDLLTLANELEQPMVLERYPFGKMKGRLVSEIPRGYLNWCRTNFTEVHRDIEATICSALGCEEWILK
jgi:DNA polymerase III epsilon subunit-like protein